MRENGPVIHAYKGVVPKIHATAFVAASAQVIGDVELGEKYLGQGA